MLPAQIPIGVLTLEYVFVNANAETMIRRITLFHIAAVPRNSVNGEITSQIPRIRLSQLRPNWHMLTRMPTRALTTTLFQMPFGTIPSTNGEIITQMPNTMFTHCLQVCAAQPRQTFQRILSQVSRRCGRRENWSRRALAPRPVGRLAKIALGRGNGLFKAVHQFVFALVARFIMGSQPLLINESRLASC